MPRQKKNPVAEKVQLNVLVSIETRDIFHKLKDSMGAKTIAEAVERGAQVLAAIQDAAKPK